MKVGRALNIRDDLIRGLDNLYSEARHWGMLSSEIETRRTKLLAAYPGVPGWVTSYCSGYWRALINDAYARHLVFGGYYNGVFFSTHRDRKDYYEKNKIEPRDWADDGRVKDKGHYWAECINAPRPYFIS